jgi:putative DNA primase/helicase
MPDNERYGPFHVNQVVNLPDKVTESLIRSHEARHTMADLTEDKNTQLLIGNGYAEEDLQELKEKIFKQMSDDELKKKIINDCKQNGGYFPQNHWETLGIELSEYNRIVSQDGFLEEFFRHDEQTQQWRLKSPEDYFEDDKFIPKRLGDEIKSRYIFKTTTSDEEVFFYKDGVYVPAESFIKELCSQKLEEMETTHRVEETLNYIKYTTFVDRKEFNKDKELINLKNGIFNLKKMELQPHSPEILMTNQLPVVYKTNADCLLIKEFCSQIVSESDILLLQEITGYCLWKDYHIQKAVMLIGDGANGKSTFLSLLKYFLGLENISSVSLQDLIDRRFASAELFGKLANIYADLPDVALLRTGMFKMLTGGDLIPAEKKFKDMFTYINFAKLIFSTNKIPESKDSSSAFFRRWVMINFPYKFEGEKADKKILEKFITEGELSGLFNWAIEGLKRLLENGEFSYTLTTEQIQDKYERMSSTVAAFVKDCLDVKSDGVISKAELYQRYIDYCRENSLPEKASNIFAMDLPRYITVETQRRKTNGIGKVHCWVGIKYKEEGDKGGTLGDFL